MSFIPRVACRNCGTQFSALRMRCPNCGAAHVRRTSRSAPARASGNAAPAAALSQWQMIFGGILVVAVIVAVIILITASLNPPATTVAPSETPALPSLTPPLMTEEPEPTPTPEPTTAVSSITIHTSWDSATPVTDFTVRVGDTVPLVADVYPTEARTTAKVNWRSTDEGVCTVSSDGVVTAVGSGSCQIIADSGSVTQQTIARVP
ncbi:MAG: Ig-like domain-containing protein [Oscillospiraceae bacterium]|nr:Ig-like domain-containing protein [Oscillospiraceae bacterium]